MVIYYPRAGSRAVTRPRKMEIKERDVTAGITSAPKQYENGME